MSNREYYLEAIMGITRNLSAADLYPHQNRTNTDEKQKDYIFGSIFLVATVLGLIVNSILINYYRKHRRAWIHKFCFALAIVNLIYMLIRGVPTTILLLVPKLHVDEFSNLEEIINVLCYVVGAIETIILAAIFFVQYTNIFHPGWTLLNGPSTCWHRVTVLGIILCLFFFTPAYVLLLQRSHYLFIDELMFNLPLLMITVAVLCVHLATRVRFRRLKRGLVLEVIEKVQRDFKLVNIIATWRLIWFISTVLFLKYISEDHDKDIKYIPVQRVDVFICNLIVPMVEFTFLSCAMLCCDRDALDFTFRRRQREYATLNGSVSQR